MSSLRNLEALRNQAASKWHPADLTRGTLSVGLPAIFLYVVARRLSSSSSFLQQLTAKRLFPHFYLSTALTASCLSAFHTNSQAIERAQFDSLRTHLHNEGRGVEKVETAKIFTSPVGLILAQSWQRRAGFTSNTPLRPFRSLLQMWGGDPNEIQLDESEQRKLLSSLPWQWETPPENLRAIDVALLQKLAAGDESDPWLLHQQESDPELVARARRLVSSGTSRT